MTLHKLDWEMTGHFVSQVTETDKYVESDSLDEILSRLRENHI